MCMVISLQDCEELLAALCSSCVSAFNRVSFERKHSSRLALKHALKSVTLKLRKQNQRVLRTYMTDNLHLV